MRLYLDTSLVVIVACAVLHNTERLRSDPLPENDDAQPLQENVDAAPVCGNQGGQSLRNLMIRNLE